MGCPPGVNKWGGDMSPSPSPNCTHALEGGNNQVFLPEIMPVSMCPKKKNLSDRIQDYAINFMAFRMIQEIKFSELTF